VSGAIPQFPQYAFMAWCSVEAQGQLYFTLLLYMYLNIIIILKPFIALVLLQNEAVVSCTVINSFEFYVLLLSLLVRT
jgi:hypothetical protein